MTPGDARDLPASIGELLDGMQHRLDALPPGQVAARDFLGTYLRTTAAVAGAVESGTFEDPAWVEHWDLVFAGLYLDALDAHLSGERRPSRPWRLAFDAAPGLPALLNVLLGVNAHINYDLPQALLAVIPDAEFRDPSLLERRRRDHERIDAILSGRVAAEDAEISARSVRTVLDRALQPINRWASRRFLKEARQKVWNNTLELWRAKSLGEDAYATRLAELELLSAAKIADLLAPGQVLLRLAVAGFGVSLPPPAN
jgi:Family of unknown function (DUF5995)